MRSDLTIASTNRCAAGRGGVTARAWPRAVLAVGVLIIASACVKFEYVVDATPVPKLAGVPINVRWADDVTPDLRVELERRYGLTERRRLEGRVFAYRLSDSSAHSVLAIIGDPRVADTAYVDRVTGKPVGD